MQAVPSVPPIPTVHAPPLMSLSAGIRWATLALAVAGPAKAAQAMTLCLEFLRQVPAYKAAQPGGCD